MFAAAAVPLWLWMLSSGAQTIGPFTGAAWHAHEMIFGYLAAVMAGFVMTAVPNWTGRLPLSGWPLGGLFLLWATGRIACSTVSDPIASLILDMLFLAALSAALWREVLAGKNWRNAPIALLLTLFAGANLLHHLEAIRPSLEGSAVRLSLGVAAVLMALVGGRVVPSFTRNWLVKRGHVALPAPFIPADPPPLKWSALRYAFWQEEDGSDADEETQA